MSKSIHSRKFAIMVALTTALASAAPTSAQEFALEETTVRAIQDALASGSVDCETIVQGYLDRIEAYDQTGPSLNTIQTLNPRALEEARALDTTYRSSGPVGPLHCVPVLLKDQVETSDMPTSYGSVIFQDFTPDRDATIVTRMKDAGAIILAKTTMGEFASRFVGSAFGVVRNAYDPTRNPSGSSGGTGSAVAANFGAVGIGEDTSGSIRGPAAVNSLVGLRPTVPLVSRFGMMPATPTTDTLGPMTRTVEDAAILLDVIAGYDPNDPLTAYTVGRVPESYTAALERGALEGARIGLLRAPMHDKTDPESEDYQKVASVMARAYDALEGLGATLVDPVEIEGLQELFEKMSASWYETEPATDAYLEQHENAPAKTLQEILLTGDVTPWRAAALIKAVGKKPTDAPFLELLLAREELRQRVLKLMADEKLDAIAYATFDHQPTVIAEDVLTNPKTEDAYGLGSNRGLSPSTGFPALTLPAGFTTDGLPVGLELLGRPFTEDRLLALGYGFEQGTKLRRPPTTTPPLTRSADDR